MKHRIECSSLSSAAFLFACAFAAGCGPGYGTLEAMSGADDGEPSKPGVSTTGDAPNPMGSSGSPGGSGSDPSGSTTGPEDASTTAGQETGETSGETPTGESRCEVTKTKVTCGYETTTLEGLATPRDVHFQVPLGSPPPGGWPVVIYFQGSFVTSEAAFWSIVGDVWGQDHLTLTVKALLDAGYAVLAPEALGGGTTSWQTNVPPWPNNWTGSPDHAFMLALFEQISAGRFGPLDASKMYAMGISSGGFMTSRMAVDYPGKFRALMIHSGSYATCYAVCSPPIPRPLPADHPPTLFLHGLYDNLVPVATMTLYREALDEDGIEVDVVIDEKAAHQWLEVGPEVVLEWFETHP